MMRSNHGSYASGDAQYSRASQFHGWSEGSQNWLWVRSSSMTLVQIAQATNPGPVDPKRTLWWRPKWMPQWWGQA